jgi:DUF438 domain-containing protein
MENEDITEGDVELKAQLADDHSDDIFKELNIRYLRDLYIRSKKEFEQFRTMSTLSATIRRSCRTSTLSISKRSSRIVSILLRTLQMFTAT